MAKRSMHPTLGGLAAIGFPLVRMLPVRLASEALAAIVGRLAGICIKREAMRRNLEIAFPDLDEPTRGELMRRIAGNLGRLVAEVAHIPTFAAGRQGTRLEPGGALDYPLGRRAPAIYVSAHLCNWELLPVVFRRHGILLTIIYTALADPRLDRRLLALRRATGATYVEKAGALRSCVKALTSGNSIALLVDQRVESGIEIDFFGRRTLFTHLPARMALRFGCPIIPVETVRVAPGHLKAVFHEPIWPEAERGEDAAQVLTQRMANAIEVAIRRNPDEWFCNKRRWKKEPKKTPGAPAHADEAAGSPSAVT